MNKNAFIEKWGIVAYEKRMKLSRDWRQAHPENTEKWHKQIRVWQQTHPVRVKRLARDYYRKHREEIFDRRNTVVESLRRSIRAKYGRIWREYKRIIAPTSQLNYVWIPETAEYKCIALVGKDQRQYPFKDVIHIPREAPIAKRSILEALLVYLRLKPAIITKFKQQMPAFTEEELQAGV